VYIRIGNKITGDLDEGEEGGEVLERHQQKGCLIIRQSYTTYR